MKEISVKKLKEILDNLNEDQVIIDVRTAVEFSEVRIDSPAVENIEVNSLINQTSGLEGKSVYLICNSGSRSGMAQIILSQKGVDAINVESGMVDWIESNLPVIKS